MMIQEPLLREVSISQVDVWCNADNSQYIAMTHHEIVYTHYAARYARSGRKITSTFAKRTEVHEFIVL